MERSFCLVRTSNWEYEVNPHLVRPMEMITAKTTEGEFGSGTQIFFHLTQNEMLNDLFKKLSQTLQAFMDVKRPRSQTVRAKRRFSSDIYKSVAVRFLFSKRSGKFHCWNLITSRKRISNGKSLLSTKTLCEPEAEACYMDCRGRPEKFVVKKKPMLSKVTWKNLEVTRDLFVIILWWKSFPGLARGNSWCLWTWKSKSEITKIPVQTSFLVAWKTPPGFTLPCRSNLYLKTCRLPIIGLKCASIKIHQVL